MTYLDGKAALESIEPSLQEAEDTHNPLGHISDEFERNVSPAQSVHRIHNQQLPIMSLPHEIFRVIFENAAHKDPPSSGLQKLGWIAVSHVCSVWRRIVLPMAHLWAREVGAFGSCDSFNTIIARAGGEPLTIINPWVRPGFSLDLYWPVLSRSSSIHTIRLEKLDQKQVQDLAAVLSKESFTGLHSLALSSHEDHSGVSLKTMACHPNLRWLSFKNMFIPAIGRALVGLLVVRDTKYLIGTPSITCPAFLDTLETCTNLKYLCLDEWMPLNVPSDEDWFGEDFRKVRLPELRTLVLK